MNVVFLGPVELKHNTSYSERGEDDIRKAVNIFFIFNLIYRGWMSILKARRNFLFQIGWKETTCWKKKQ